MLKQQTAPYSVEQTRRYGAIASAPGRVCWYGDHFDWMRGAAVVSAVRPFRTWVHLEESRSSTTTFESLNAVLKPGVADLLRGQAYVDAVRTVIGRRLGCRVPHMKVSVLTTFPIGAGLSSSAALCVATAQAIKDYFDFPLTALQIAESAYQAERNEMSINCGRMDQYASALGGLLHINFVDGSVKIAKLPPPKGVALVVVNSGITKDTNAVLSGLRSRLTAGDLGLLRYMGTCTSAISRGRAELDQRVPDPALLGQLMNECQYSLDLDVAVSVPEISRLCRISLEAGAYGAKLTGSGGGGAVIALCSTPTAKAVRAALSINGSPAHVVAIESHGVRREKWSAWQAIIKEFLANDSETPGAA